MKKTHTANISGTVFHIEEDAYEMLQRYLGNIRAQFAGTSGSEEIMADIEARVAELLHERLDDRRQVVTSADVDHVVATMGQPEDFSDGESEGPGTPGAAEPPPFSGKRYKRLFRDPDDKWVGGVIGGLAAYVGMDPIWLRVIMIILILLGKGTPIILYLLLWILVPKAENAADRLQMRGEAVTVDNIKRVVEEGAEKMKQGGQRMASEAKEMGREWQSGAARRTSAAGEVITKLAGVLLILIGLSALMSLVTALIGGTVSLWHLTWSNEEMSLMDIGALLFSSKEQTLWAVIGAFTLIAIPIIALFLAGFRLLLDRRTPKWLGWSLALIWLAAWIPAVMVGVDLAHELHRENSTTTTLALTTPSAGVLYLDALDPAKDNANWSVHYNDGDLDVDLEGVHLENGTVVGAWARLDVERSPDSLYHLRVVRTAHGRTAKDALFRAERIAYDHRQDGDALLVSPLVHYSMNDKFRMQDVQFTLEVPLGKSVFLRPGSRSVIYDIDNVTNTYDGKMIGRTWTMTERGLLDPNAPQQEAGNDEAAPAPPAPVDSVRKHSPVVALPYRGPSPRKASARAEEEDYQLPSLLSLIRPRGKW